MFNSTIIYFVSIAGWAYLFYIALDYFSSRFLGLQLFKEKNIKKEIKIILLGFLIFACVGFIEIVIKGGADDCGLFGNFFISIFVYFLIAPQSLFFSFIAFLSILKFYQYIIESQRNRFIKFIIGLLIFIILISQSLGGI